MSLDLIRDDADSILFSFSFLYFVFFFLSVFCFGSVCSDIEVSWLFRRLHWLLFKLLKLCVNNSPFKKFQYYSELLKLMVSIDYNKIYQGVIVNMFFLIEILFGNNSRNTGPWLFAFLLFYDFKTLILKVNLSTFSPGGSAPCTPRIAHKFARCSPFSQNFFQFFWIRPCVHSYTCLSNVFEEKIPPFKVKL